MPTQINSNDVSGATSGLLNLIRMISGKDKVTGGPVMDANGNITIAPYQGSTGFLGGASRRQAQSANSQLLPKIYEQQMQNIGQLDVEQMRSLYELAKQLSINSNTLENTKLLNQGQVSAKEQEGKNTVAADTNKADLEILKSYGLPASALKEVEEKLSPEIIRALVAQKKSTADAYNDKETDYAIKASVKANEFAPALDSLIKGQLKLQPGESAITTDIFRNPMSLFTGVTSNDKVVNTGGFPDAKGNIIGGTPTKISTSVPASKQSLSPTPEILQRARSVGGNNLASEVPNPDSTLGITNTYDKAMNLVSPFNAGRISPFLESATNVPTDGNLGLLSDPTRFFKPQQTPQIGGLDSLLDSGAVGLLKLINFYQKYGGNDPALRTYNNVIDNPM